MAACPEPVLVERVLGVMERLIGLHAPDLVVVACNTASTLVLPALRQRFATPFVGVVPPIKPAAEATRSGVISLLATPGTVARAYTHELIETYAGACAVTLVGAPNLAGFAEAELAGQPMDDAALAREIAPCFVTLEDGRRTDVVCLACTHYPLLLARFRAPCALARDLDRPGPGHRPAGDAAPRPEPRRPEAGDDAPVLGDLHRRRRPDGAPAPLAGQARGVGARRGGGDAARPAIGDGQPARH